MKGVIAICILLLGGCAAADAGKATTSVTVSFPYANFDNGAIVTITSTVTPTATTSGQTPTNTTDIPVTIPASVIPK